MSRGRWKSIRHILTRKVESLGVVPAESPDFPVPPTFRRTTTPPSEDRTMIIMRFAAVVSRRR
jgi:hypothetical protein